MRKHPMIDDVDGQPSIRRRRQLPSSLLTYMRLCSTPPTPEDSHPLSNSVLSETRNAIIIVDNQAAAIMKGVQQVVDNKKVNGE